MNRGSCFLDHLFACIWRSRVVMDASGLGFFAIVLQFWILLAAGQGRIFF